MKIKFGMVILIRVRPWIEAVIGLGAFSPKRTWSDLGSTYVEPVPVAPGNPGITKRKLLQPTRSPRRLGHVAETIAMDLIYACCAGLDVHKKTVVACVRRAR